MIVVDLTTLDIVCQTNISESFYGIEFSAMAGTSSAAALARRLFTHSPLAMAVCLTISRLRCATSKNAACRRFGG